MYGLWMLKKHPFNGINLILNNRRFQMYEYTMLQLFVYAGVLMEWWLSLEVVLLINRHWMILGVWGNIEMEDGIGWKRHIGILVQLKLQEQGINTIVCLWERWCLLWVEEQTKWEKAFRLRSMILKHPNGIVLLQFKDFGMHVGSLIDLYLSMVDLIKIHQTFQQMLQFELI